ncbi:hypothetical protein ACIRST_02580 [Kitasatospora sp. NPDC101447]|uniref:hypothetical protein n=1 Tax=Kitasatospora sp. NPDC101447 TaxID=3364102 RepID=UPI003823954D
MTATHGPDRAPPPDRTTYRVTYRVLGEVREDEVTVVPGYSQESDIPRILAARLGALPAVPPTAPPTARPAIRPARHTPERRPEVVVIDLREI